MISSPAQSEVLAWFCIKQGGEVKPYKMCFSLHPDPTTQCREISKLNSATSGNPMSPRSGTKLYPPRRQHSPQSGVY